jgi:hypothetical protein
MQFLCLIFFCAPVFSVGKFVCADFPLLSALFRTVVDRLVD